MITLFLLTISGVWLLRMTVKSGKAKGWGVYDARLNWAGRGRPCGNGSCRTPNPGHAKFCRRCGSRV